VPTALPVEAFDAASFEADAELIRVENPGVDEIEALAQARSLGQGGDALAGESAAAFSRQPLLQRLVALQDAATDAAASEAVGRLIARHADAKRVIARAAGLEAALSFDQLKAGYEALYASCVIRPQHAGEVAWHRKKLVQYRPRYEAVSTRTGVPWWFIGIVHALEVSFNFNGHLHNGDPLGARTVRVPQGRPAQWKPPTDWESSAVDALTIKNFVAQDDWSVARALHRFEGYNGFGYHGQGIESPYLWSFSNHYTRGKFVADHLFDPNAVSRQCGAAVMMRALQEAGLLEAELT